jgi:hypothetical protein
LPSECCEEVGVRWQLRDAFILCVGIQLSITCPPAVANAPVTNRWVISQHTPRYKGRSTRSVLLARFPQMQMHRRFDSKIARIGVLVDDCCRGSLCMARSPNKQVKCFFTYLSRLSLCFTSDRLTDSRYRGDPQAGLLSSPGGMQARIIHDLTG